MVSMEWMFDVYFLINQLQIMSESFVYATGEPANIAYFIQVGHNEGNISLYSWPASSNNHKEY